MDSWLEVVAKKFHSSRNIHEKKQLKPIIDQIRQMGYNSSQIYTSYGEDAAAIKPNSNSDELILVTTDAIIPEFISATPWGAGYSAIYVGIDDILTCGGVPIAATITMAYASEETGKEMLRGIIDATNKFRIPVIRGHTTTDSKNLMLTSTIIGRATIGKYRSIKNVKEGQVIGIAWDPDGSFAKVNPMFWNTITNKSTEFFYKKRKFIRKGIDMGILDFCKDISMGGILGTIYQIIQVTHLGATLDLEPIFNNQVIRNMKYKPEDFLFAYLTSAFVIATKSNNIDDLKKLIKKSEMEFLIIGKIIKEHTYTIRSDGEEQNLI